MITGKSIILKKTIHWKPGDCWKYLQNLSEVNGTSWRNESIPLSGVKLFKLIPKSTIKSRMIQEYLLITKKSAFLVQYINYIPIFWMLGWLSTVKYLAVKLNRFRSKNIFKKINKSSLHRSHSFNFNYRYSQNKK